MSEITDQDVEAFEAEIEESEIREQFRQQYFAVDEYGVRRMTDPAYASSFRTALQAALDLQRSANGLALEGAAFEAPREPSKEERAAWEKSYFAVDPKTGRRLMEDPQYAARVDATRDRTFGIRRRDATGRIVA